MIVATPPTLLAVTPLPAKLIVFAAATTLVPSSCTETPLIPPDIVIVATPPTLLAVTPEPTKLIVVVDATTLVPSSCIAIDGAGPYETLPSSDGSIYRIFPVFPLATSGKYVLCPVI